MTSGNKKIGDLKMDKKKILIVDDDMDLRRMLKKRFTAEGYSVATAYNGNNALALVESERPNIIVLDRILGDMFGEEVAEKLRKDPETQDIPIIFLSALTLTEDEIEKYPVFNNCPMFAKPYEMKELLTAIDKLLCNVATL